MRRLCAKGEFKGWTPGPRSSKVFSTFLYHMHSIWHNVEVLDPLDLSFVQVYISIYNLVRLSISLMSTVCSYCLFFPVSISHFFVLNQVSIGVWFYLWVFGLTPLIPGSLVFMSKLCCFNYYNSGVLLGILTGETSSHYFIFQDCSNCPKLFVFPQKMNIALWRSEKNCVGLLMGTALNL